MCNSKNTTYFARHYLCNRSNLDVVMFGYIDVNKSCFRILVESSWNTLRVSDISTQQL
jgi:hypothetical protein